MAGKQGTPVVLNAPGRDGRSGARRPRRWSALRHPEVGLVVAIAATLGLIYALQPSHSFYGAASLENLAQMVALFGFLAVGAAVVIIAGGIDLSVGSVVALAAVVSAKLMTEWLPGAGGPPSAARVAAAIALTLLMGLAIGVLHAVMINNLRLPPFIATLATLAGLRSLATVICGNQSITIPSKLFQTLGADYRYSLAIFAVVAAITSVVMGWTVLGRHLYALGGNESAARLSGLPTRRLKLVAYSTSGVLAALAGMLFAGYNGVAEYKLGTGYELNAITAAVVGGCSLSGGVGSIRGTILGLILIQVVIKGTGLVVQGIDPTQIEGLVLGTVVVLAVAFNQRFRSR